MRLILGLRVGCMRLRRKQRPAPRRAARRAHAIITYNMYYGLATDLVPEDLSTGSLSASATAIINATSLTDFRCRIDGAAAQIVAEAARHDRAAGGAAHRLRARARRPLGRSVIVDFIDELIDAIRRAGGPRYRRSSARTPSFRTACPLFGGLRIADRGAILVHPRLAAKEAARLTFSVLEPASIAARAPTASSCAARSTCRSRSPPAPSTSTTRTCRAAATPRCARRRPRSWRRGSPTPAPPAARSVLTGDLNDVATSPAVTTLDRRARRHLRDRRRAAGLHRLPGAVARRPGRSGQPAHRLHPRELVGGRRQPRHLQRAGRGRAICGRPITSAW